MLTDIKYQIKSIELNNKLKFIILSAHTKSHQDLSIRLEKSMQGFDLNRIAIEVPSIHMSVSPKGTEDCTYTKPNIIKHVLKLFNKPVVYIDSDCIVNDYPYLFDYLVNENYDFAFFNWLNCSDNSAYRPVNLEISNKYVFSHSIDYISETELVCSGAVQFWGNTINSIKLLDFWQETISENPNSPDDQSLDCSFNNFKLKNNSKFYWLPKEYIRYAWWIFSKPIIDHPDFPYSGDTFKILENYNGNPRIHVENIFIKSLTDEILLKRKTIHILPVNTNGRL